MKKLLLLIMLFTFGCVSKTSYVPEIYMVLGYDFTKYTEKGFLFTPNKYQGNYESIGMITLIYYPEANLVKTTKKSETGTSSVSYDWKVNNLNSSLLLDSLYSLSSSMGADAFTEFSITDTKEMSYGVGSVSPISIKGTTISGFAIRRLRN